MAERFLRNKSAGDAEEDGRAAVRVGLAGLDQAAERVWLPGLAALRAEGFPVEVTALADGRERRRDEVGGRLDLPDEACHAEYAELFDRGDVDAVLVGLPLPLRPDAVQVAAETGRPVLVAPPPAESADEAEAMGAAMEAAGCLYGVAIAARYGPVERAIREAVAGGAVGPVRALRLSEGGPGPSRRDGVRGRTAELLGDGSPIFWDGLALFDLVRWWTGAEVTEVVALGAAVRDAPTADHVAVLARLSDGALAEVTVSWATGHRAGEAAAAQAADRQFELVGADGVIRYRSDRLRLTVLGRHGLRQETLPDRPRTTALLRDFLTSVRAGQRVGDWATGLDAARAAEAALAAAAQL